MERVSLAVLPTPLQEVRRLRAALGGEERCPRILIKRDDLTGLAFGGNKVRKLEFLLADALREGANVLITAGAVQSNHARATAAAARTAGMRCVLVLDTKVGQPPVQGNLLLDRLLDAEIRLVPDGTDADVTMAAVADELRAAGERPYVIPGGGSNAIGVYGYVAGTLEMVEQCRQLGIAPSRLYYANGSRGTQAGLVLGAKIVKAPWRAVGIAVSGGEEYKRPRALRIANEAAARMGVPERIVAADLENHEEYIGPGYAALTEGCAEAITLLARTEAIFLDPIYTGKGMTGLIDHIRKRRIDAGETVIFLHSGGTPALFARAEELLERLLQA